MEPAGSERSYAANSQLQSFGFRIFAQPRLLPLISASLEAYFRQSATVRRPFSVVDLGCSHGPNALLCCSTITAELRRLLSATNATLDLLYYFSDLPSNDFNSLFNDIVSQADSFNGEAEAGGGAVKLFVAGVPGSFYHRLFPSQSLHLLFSSCSLHWLSQVPSEVVDPTSEAWNGGYVWLHNSRPRVAEAYARQSQRDLAAFWSCRATEMASGGVLFLFTISRHWEVPPEDESYQRNDIWMGHFQTTWEELVVEGIVSQHELDTFNIPSYNSHPDELRRSISDKDFEILHLEELNECNILPDDHIHLRQDPLMFGKFWANFLAGVSKPMVEKHLGSCRAELIVANSPRLVFRYPWNRIPRHVNPHF